MNNIPTLFVGPTGTGKSVYINNVLLDRLNKEKFNIIQVGFSAQTGANQVQNIIDQKSDKRRAGIFGPKIYGMRAVVFIDDLNMPVKEKYGAQPPVEILRQLMDQGGWYDLKDNKHPFRQFVDTMCIAAMGPPGGGKSFISPRLQRHFNVVAFAFFDESTMKTIFSSILKWYFRTGGFPQDVSMIQDKLVIATLQIYR
jgi:dynein heavy chain, axonemal